MINGSCSLITEKQKLRFHQNDIFCIPAKIFHQITEQSGDLLLHSFRLNVRPTGKTASGVNAFKLLQERLLGQNEVNVIHDCQKAIEQIHIIRDEMRWQAEGFAEALSAHFKRLFITLLRALMNVEKRASQPGERFDIDPSGLMPTNRKNIDISIIEDYFNFRQSVSPYIETLAGMLNLTPNYTHKLIRQLYGMSFVQKLTKTRIVKAQHMLLNSQASIEQIAEAVGYQSVNGFRAAFKKYSGITLAEYRKSARSGDG